MQGISETQAAALTALPKDSPRADELRIARGYQKVSPKPLSITPSLAHHRASPASRRGFSSIIDRGTHTLPPLS